MLTDGLVAMVLAADDITAVIADRIQPIPAPPDVDAFCPGVTYQAASDLSENTLDGSAGIATARIIFDCYAKRYRDARLLALQFKKLFDGFTGDLPDGTHVHACASANLVDRFDDGSRIYCTSFHALIVYGD